MKKDNPMKPKRNYKDSLFRYLFGNEAHKDWTLQLYNALNDTSFTEPSEIEFTTMEDVVYLKLKNDISFLCRDTLSMWEHQSTKCSAMTLRFYIYYERQLQRFLSARRVSLYGRSDFKLENPQFYVFYNGTEYEKDVTVLNLQDHFLGNGRKVNLQVIVLNINLNHNPQLMKKCRPLYEYAWLIDRIRRYKRSGKDDFDSITLAISDLPVDYVIKELLMNEKAEVTDMLMTEREYEEELKKIAWGERQIARKEEREKALKEGRKEGRKQGLKEGRKEGLKEGKEAGRNEGMREGRAEEKEKMIDRFISRGWTDEQILSIYEGEDVSEEIKRIREKAFSA